jgi:hypothetical protein
VPHTAVAALNSAWIFENDTWSFVLYTLRLTLRVRRGGRTGGRKSHAEERDAHLFIFIPVRTLRDYGCVTRDQTARKLGHPLPRQS